MNKGDDRTPRAVVLLSGGLDSATVAALAVRQGRSVYALSFDYGQRHRVELEAAARVARQLGVVRHHIIGLQLNGMGGSALTDAALAVPDYTPRAEGDIPATYVPARNLTFLSLAVGWAEVLGATEVHIGVNAVDYSGYPDCRPAFIESFERTANLATAAGLRRNPFKIVAPLQNMTKAEIIRQGVALGLDYRDTISCYNPDEQGRACGACDACHFRRQGFQLAGLPDQTRYQKNNE
ncbi:7-cyano-7-deazaguanine synthase QueC [Halothiobacillus sp. DCM-1]|uniref:7-cyano-7-deazaguanine synthase QueC n=1 Tax=Halothiobacillus sp. DCM-1 TaxID=3112558 RepID=UPI003255D9C1